MRNPRPHVNRMSSGPRFNTVGLKAWRNKAFEAGGLRIAGLWRKRAVRGINLDIELKNPLMLLDLGALAGH